MTELSPISALGHALPQAMAVGDVTICENTGVALASLALRHGEAAPQPFGLTLPGPGGWAAAAGIAAFWMGPGSWMVEATGQADADFAAALKAQSPGCSVAEQTDGWVVFEITATAAVLAALLEKLANLDAPRFVPGSATRTGLEHMSVFVIRRDEGHLALLAMRSAAASVVHAVETAARRLQRA